MMPIIKVIEVIRGATMVMNLPMKLQNYPLRTTQVLEQKPMCARLSAQSRDTIIRPVFQTGV